MHPEAATAVNECFEEVANCSTSSGGGGGYLDDVHVGDDCEVIDTGPRGFDRTNLSFLK